MITPNEYMYETYKHLGKSKVEVYSEVVRNIYSEVGGFRLSDKTFKESLDYDNYIRDQKMKNA